MAGGYEQLKRLADHLLLAVTEKRPRRAIERLDQSAVTGRHDPVGNVLEYRPRADLAGCQRCVETRDRFKRLLQLLGLNEQTDEGGVKMKSTAPLAYAVAVSTSSDPKAVTNMIGVSSD
jgi:hypothetical protein